MKSRIYALVALGVIGALLYALGWVGGAGHELDRAKQLETKQLRQAFEQGQALGTVRDRVVTEYVDRVEVIETQGKTIIQRVPVYVTPDDDARCAVPDGFIRLHDAAARAVDIGAGPGAADAPGPLAAAPP
ncbi:hypothetical protein 3S15_28 [uncultured Caudovirales phage]|uniref:Uncharacterized protein n=1 Tax=uncultured Caudovirales phage TaxID=2100421 RepID=A0A2H4JAC5_9CAUD|nr:hypothetical protein 3S15_28 [uncultured Caudovirales phage]